MCVCVCVCVCIYIYIYEVKLTTVVEGNLKALFAIITIPRC